MQGCQVWMRSMIASFPISSQRLLACIPFEYYFPDVSAKLFARRLINMNDLECAPNAPRAEPRKHSIFLLMKFNDSILIPVTRLEAWLWHSCGRLVNFDKALNQDA